MKYPEGMLFSYTHHHGAQPFTDTAHPLYVALESSDGVSDALDSLDYGILTQAGDPLGTALYVYSAQHVAYFVKATIGECDEIGYIIPTGHDLLCFMREFLPTVTALAEADGGERDRIATQAMTGLLADPELGDTSPAGVARTAYKYADAMMAEREIRRLTTPF